MDLEDVGEPESEKAATKTAKSSAKKGTRVPSNSHNRLQPLQSSDVAEAKTPRQKQSQRKSAKSGKKSNARQSRASADGLQDGDTENDVGDVEDEERLQFALNLIGGNMSVAAEATQGEDDKVDLHEESQADGEALDSDDDAPEEVSLQTAREDAEKETKCRAQTPRQKRTPIVTIPALHSKGEDNPKHLSAVSFVVIQAVDCIQVTMKARKLCDSALNSSYINCYQSAVWL